MKYRSHLTVRHVAPEDIHLGTEDAGRMLTDQVGDGLSTGTFAVFDTTARSKVATLPLTPFTSIIVGNAGLFTVGDYVEVILDDATESVHLVDTVTPSTNTIVLNTGPASAPRVGRPVRKIYGPQPASQRITMAMGGETPRVGEEDWDWRGLFVPSSFPDIVPDLEVEIETVIVKTGGNGARSVKSRCVLIEADCA